MKHKLQSFKKQIRKNQISSYFSVRREQQVRLSSNKQITFIIQEEARNRKAIPSTIQVELENQNNGIDCSFQQKCLSYESELKIFYLKSQYSDFLMVMKQIIHELKRILKLQKTEKKQESENLVNIFLSKNILSIVVDAVIKATQEKTNAGILQQLSKKAISILNYSIESSATSFGEQLFINSNLLLFLRCCIDQPKFDEDHLTNIIAITAHMIIVSVNNKSQLFNILNSKNSKFNFAAIFYNLTRISLNPNNHITQNFIISMKHYLLKIEQDLLKEQKYNQNAKPVTCLQNNYIKMLTQITTVSVNSLVFIDFYDQQAVDALQEALQVSRILIQYFNVNEKYKFRLDFIKLIKILYFKDCRTEIKCKILKIVDHIIYQEDVGDIAETLVRQCELIPSLWLLLNDFYSYSMNIFCNLVLNKSLKPFLNPYVHNIFSYFKHSKGDKLLWTFVYNWFSSQDFQISESRDRLVVELMKDSQQTNPKVIQIQCLLWYQLAAHNSLQVPQRIFSFQLPIVKKLRTLAFGQQENPI